MERCDVIAIKRRAEKLIKRKPDDADMLEMFALLKTMQSGYTQMRGKVIAAEGALAQIRNIAKEGAYGIGTNERAAAGRDIRDSEQDRD